MQSLSIRPARPEDAPALAAVFRDAIHGKASGSYNAAQLTAWSAGRNEEQFRREVEHGLITFLVAETTPPGGDAATSGKSPPRRHADGGQPPQASLVGFGALRHDEVAYLYAAPHAPQGTGSALLRELECRARAQQVPELRLTASLNALEFYKNHGYRELRRDIRVLHDGDTFVRLVAIEARKRLVP